MASEFPPLPLQHLENLIAAMHGLAMLLDPDASLDSEERGNLSFLVKLIADDFKRCLTELRQDAVQPPHEEV